MCVNSLVMVKVHGKKRLAYFILIDEYSTEKTTKAHIEATLTSKEELDYFENLVNSFSNVPVLPANENLWYSTKAQSQFLSNPKAFKKGLKEADVNLDDHFDSYFCGEMVPEELYEANKEFFTRLKGDPRLKSPITLDALKYGDIAGCQTSNMAVILADEGIDNISPILLYAKTCIEEYYPGLVIQPDSVIDYYKDSPIVIDFFMRRFDEKLPFPTILPLNEWESLLNYLSIKRKGSYITNVMLDNPRRYEHLD